uniref:Uncharacterized protein n=1 Tax=Vespula pensylvanica TaxID=30213 RepID=A0A834NQS4_VESPE|nr:hypothetical protein H0235_012333 [Vespula pensylvanica]
MALGAREVRGYRSKVKSNCPGGCQESLRNVIKRKKLCIQGFASVSSNLEEFVVSVGGRRSRSNVISNTGACGQIEGTSGTVLLPKAFAALWISADDPKWILTVLGRSCASP